MSSQLKLLIVEDDETQIGMYKSQIENFNKNSSLKISEICTKDLTSGMQMLEKQEIDAAIIDLKLSGSSDSAEGNNIIHQIKETKRFPVIVISGFPDDLDDDFQADNVFFKIYQRRDADIQKILNELVKIYKTGITKILGKKGIIEEYLHKIFWNHLADSFSSWIYDIDDDKIKEKKLLRYITQYLFEYLDIDETGNFEAFQPHEVYLFLTPADYSKKCNFHPCLF